MKAPTGSETSNTCICTRFQLWFVPKIHLGLSENEIPNSTRNFKIKVIPWDSVVLKEMFTQTHVGHLCRLKVETTSVTPFATPRAARPGLRASAEDTEHSLNTLRHACIMDGQGQVGRSAKLHQPGLHLLELDPKNSKWNQK